MTCLSFPVRRGDRFLRGWCFPVFLLFRSLFAVLSAEEISEAAGIWNNVAMSAPSRLTWDTDLRGRVVWIGGLEDFETWTGSLTVTADGQFTGPVDGTFSIVGPGLINAGVAGEAAVQFALNSRSDFMVAVKHSSDGNQQDLELLLKSPATLSAADLVGQWRGFNLLTPSVIHPLTEENRIVGLDVVGRFLVRMGSLTVLANSTITGDMGGGFTGWITTGDNGSVLVHINEPPPEPATQLHFFINSGKDILAAAWSGGEDNAQEIILFTRIPESVSAAELTGLWRGADFSVPSRLSLETNAVGEVFGIAGAHDFEFSRDAVSTGLNGGIVGLAEPFLGDLTVGTSGQIRLAGTNHLGEIFTKDLWLSAGKDVLLSMETREHQELTLALRAPSSPEAEAMASKLVCFRQDRCLAVGWATDTDRRLEWSPDLVNWTAVEESMAEGRLLVCPEADTQVYYRVVIGP